MKKKIESFAFCVLAYNHQDYIVEHLESIKFLVERYGKDINFQIIVNDDFSKDNTVVLLDSWLDANAQLFSKIDRIYNRENFGTCASVINMLGRMSSEYCKLTAGDDVYSYENIFLYAPLLDENEIVSGIPLDLTDGVISKKLFDVFNMVASDLIYSRKTLASRFKNLSLNNAPNIFYRADCLKDKSVLEFLSCFDVVEDWPLQIAIAQKNRKAKFCLVDKVFVYYRRTPGSTYLVASTRFYNDQSKIFGYLIGAESNFFQRLILRNRLFCFLSGSKFVKRFLNLAVVIYFFNCLLRVGSISRVVRALNCSVDVSKHAEHYRELRSSSRKYDVYSSVDI
ncbi:glycosyltransferase [Pseudomonas sp. MWU12-2534b]|nr:glycosyltransferase [Pseudomonas sp. MWU12-2534b]